MHYSTRPNENKCSGTVASNLNDVYCIKLDGTSDLNINVSGKCVQEKTGTCRIRIIDKEYTVISSRTKDVDISGRASCRFVGYLSKGNYYLVIDYETQSSNNYMDYTIELSCEKMEDSFPEEIGGSDGTFATANNIEIGNLYHGIITFDDKANIDVYKLELTEEKIIEVNAYILKNCTSFKLYNEEIGLLDCKDIENIDDFSTNDKPIGKYKLDKGIYYLCFGDEDSKNIYYNFQIIESLHNWDDGEITTPATCYQEGVKTYRCLDKGCTETYTEPIPINEDNHDYLPEFIWSENGESCQIKFICKYNGSHTALYDATVTSIATKEPTCSTKGITTYIAVYDKFVDKKEIQDIPLNPSNHTWEDSFTIDAPATATTAGKQSIHCSGCNEKRNVTEIPVSGTSTGGDINSSIDELKKKAEDTLKKAEEKLAQAEMAKREAEESKRIADEKIAKAKAAQKAADEKMAEADKIIASANNQSTVLREQKISTAKIKTYKVSNLKKKKVTFSLKAKTSGNGKLIYKVTKGKNITVSKSGKVTLKKGIKKGTYKIKITALQTSKYKKAAKTVSIKVK